MPIGAFLVTGSLLLAGAPQASAVTVAAVAAGGVNLAPAAGEVAATVTVTQTVTARRTRSATARATRKLTSKVKVTRKATRRASRSATVTRSVTATRYAPTAAEAKAEATAVARKAAWNAAAAVARTTAAKAAAARARAVAKKAAAAAAKRDLRKRFGNVVVARAAAQKGKPYRWGAAGPNAFDCSGLVTYVMKKAGVKGLPRTSSAISNHVRHISKSTKKRGDLVFFASGGHVYHVAIYAGGGRIWHAPGSGRTVRKVKIWTGGYMVGRAA
jgi:cell wall-associated NlpC family hydrolase